MDILYTIVFIIGIPTINTKRDTPFWNFTQKVIPLFGTLLSYYSLSHIISQESMNKNKTKRIPSLFDGE